MRVPDFLAEQHVAFERILHPPAFTALKRARFLQVTPDEVAKSVLLAGPAGYFLAVLPAPFQVDVDALAAVLGGPVRQATDREVMDVFRDCEWGVIPPFGTLYGLPTVIDDGLDPEALLIFETTRLVEDVRLYCRDFERLERPRRLPVARR